MEDDGDEFGPNLYSDVVKPCSSVKQPGFSNDQKPLNLHASSDFSANVYKDLEEYDGFLLSECGGGGGGLLPECGLEGDFDDVEMEENEVEFGSVGLDFEGKDDKMDEDNEINVLYDDLELENLKGLTDEDICVNVEDSESDESFDIIIDDNDLNDKGVASGKKDVEKEELGLLRNGNNILDFEGKDDKMDEDNEINALYDDLELENLRGLKDDDLCVNVEDSESDDSFDIIMEDDDPNDDNVGGGKKHVEKRELGLLRNCDDPYDLDDLEPGEIAGMKAELGIDVEARVGHSYQPFHTVPKGVRSAFTPQTVDADSKAEKYQVNPFRNANYNYGGTKLRYLPMHFKKAFNIEVDYLGDTPWKRPGVNLSDFFNFDLDEENWQNYCKQMKQLLQTSRPSMAVGYKSEQLQSKNTQGKQIGQAIQVQISHGERVSCLENHHQREGDSDAIIEIVVVDSPDKDLKDRALHDYKKHPTTIHKIINGDKILPFPLDGSLHQISHGEKYRTSHQVAINYAQEERQWTDFNSMISRKKARITYQDWSMHLDHPKERREAEQGLRGKSMKYDKVMPLYSNKDVRKNNEGQTTFRNRLEDDNFHNSGEKRLRHGDSNYKKSLKQPDESKPTADVHANQEITGNRFNNFRMRIEETLPQTDHQEGNIDNNLDKGSTVDEDNCRMRIEETLSQEDHQEGTNDNELNKGSVVDEDNCRMRIEETSSKTDHQEGTNDNELNKGSAVDEDTCRMSIEETLSQTDHQEGNNGNKLNMGSAIDEDNFTMRIEETLSQTDHQEGTNDNELNKGSVVDEDNFRMRIEETLSLTEHQQGNNDNKLNKGSADDEDNCRMRIEETLSQTDNQDGENDNKLIKRSAFDVNFYSEQGTEPIDNPEQEFPINCNLANNLENDVIFDDQKHEAKGEDNVDEESKKMQGSPKAGEYCTDEMKQLMSNIKGFMSEVDELVHSQTHEHRICCLR